MKKEMRENVAIDMNTMEIVMKIDTTDYHFYSLISTFLHMTLGYYGLISMPFDSIAPFSEYDPCSNTCDKGNTFYTIG